MNKKIAYLRCSTVNEDIRLRKYLNACKVKNLEYLAFTWDRLSRGTFVENEIPFKRYSPYGRRWKNAGNKIAWQFFLLWMLLKNHGKFAVIHACDFDTMLPALLYRALFGGLVVYDIYDCFSSSEKNLSLGKWIIRKIDLFMLRKADWIIIADKERVKQMGIPFPFLRKVMVIENVPQTDFSNYITKKLNPEKISLSYVGVFDRNRGIENVLSFVEKHSNITLDIAGEGALREAVIAASKRCNRIKYAGFVNYADGLKLMQQSNFILGMYYKTNPEHFFAAPNKYFESLFLHVPLITTKGILLGEKVLSLKTGYVVDDTEDELEFFFDNLIKNWDNFVTDYIEREQNCRTVWDEKYSNYSQQKLQKEYFSKLSLAKE